MDAEAVEDSNVWTKTAVIIQNIESNANLLAALGQEISLMREQLSSAPNKRTKGAILHSTKE